VAGYSFGGKLAFEIAQQLLAAGERVGLLAIIDTEANGPSQRPGVSMFLAIPRFLRNLPRWIADDLLRSGPRPILDRLKRKIWATARPILQILAGSPLPGRQLEDIWDTHSWPVRVREQRQSYFDIWNAYTPGHYCGRITVLRARTRPLFHSFELDLGWGRIAAEGVDVRVVPGHHTSLLTEPYCSVLARELTTCLDRLLPDHA
jgi:thioesterase domain-containing protein